jgi:hypothetical protein
MKGNMKDYGADPIGNEKFRMVPSGDIVDKAEKERRLGNRRLVTNDCLGLSWDQIESKQGGKLTRPKKGRE